jgi:hypothetical protein
LSSVAIQPPSPRHSRRILVVGVALAVVLAGGLGGWYFLVHPPSGPSGPQTKMDGPTFYQVLSSVNGSVSNASGGPWSLVSVIGVASPIPFSPNVAGYLVLNVSVNACQQQFNGLTLWNGSLPVFDGTFNSGTAPFWQLGYYSESSQEMLVATSVWGETRVYSPMPISSNCTYSWTTLRYDPSSWVNQIYSNGTLPVDSSVAAQLAWNNLDQHWITANAPLAEVFALGPGMMTGTGDVRDGNWEVYFMGCGLAGYTGIRPIYAAGVSRGGEWGGALNGTRNCATLYSEGPKIDRGEYQFLFSGSTFSTVATTTWVNTPFQVGIAPPNGTVNGYYDGWGVADWMISINLTTSSGQLLPVGSSGCSVWVQSFSDCEANSSGWFVVLLSAGGEWQASYGATAHGGTGWLVPVTAVVSHQSIVVVVPASWSVTGDRLGITSTVPECVINGALSL